MMAFGTLGAMGTQYNLHYSITILEAKPMALLLQMYFKQVERSQ